MRVLLVLVLRIGLVFVLRLVVAERAGSWVVDSAVVAATATFELVVVDVVHALHIAGHLRATNWNINGLVQSSAEKCVLQIEASGIPLHRAAVEVKVEVWVVVGVVVVA
jgi:hypothetical protein